MSWTERSVLIVVVVAAICVGIGRMEIVIAFAKGIPVRVSFIAVVVIVVR